MSGMRAPARSLVAGAVAALLLVCGRLPAAAADPYRTVSLALGQELVALFPAAEGYVVSADAAEVFVDLAQKDLLRQGMELQVYRPGADMVHPVTKQVLGAYEKDLGVLRVSEVREKYSRGQLDEAGARAGIVAGDRVRLSSRRLRTLLHVSAAAPGIETGPLAQALLSRGEESGRFAMIDEPAWSGSLKALGAPWDAVRADPAALRRLGELAAADLLLLTRVEPGTIPLVVVEVRSLSTGSILGELSERWPAPVALVPAPAPAAAAAAGGAPAAAGPGPAVAAPIADAGEYVVRELAAPARALAAGDILGEGRLELVLTDGKKLSLYRWEEKSLVWRWDEDGRRGRRVLSLDAADLDGDGRVEVLVTQVLQGRVTSELRRWRDGALQVEGTAEGLYLRALPRHGRPALLVGQRAGVGEVLGGRVEQYRLSGESFEPVAGGALPEGVGIFGLALAPAEGSVGFYALDRTGFLYGRSPEGKSLWRSSRHYGGYPPPLPSRELFGRFFADEADSDDQMRAFQGRLIAEQAPGGVRLLVPRNFSDSPVVLVRQRAFGQGEVVILEGSPESPEEAARSRTYEGYVADLALADIDADGTAEVLFVVNRFAGPLIGERAKLVVWRPPPAPGREK